MQASSKPICRICAHTRQSNPASSLSGFHAGSRTFGSSARIGAPDKSKYILPAGQAKFPKGYTAAVSVPKAGTLILFSNLFKLMASPNFPATCTSLMTGCSFRREKERSARSRYNSIHNLTSGECCSMFHEECLPGGSGTSLSFCPVRQRRQSPIFDSELRVCKCSDGQEGLGECMDNGEEHRQGARAHVGCSRESRKRDSGHVDWCNRTARADRQDSVHFAATPVSAWGRL